MDLTRTTPGQSFSRPSAQIMATLALRVACQPFASISAASLDLLAKITAGYTGKSSSP